MQLCTLSIIVQHRPSWPTQIALLILIHGGLLQAYKKLATATISLMLLHTHMHKLLPVGHTTEWAAALTQHVLLRS